MNYLSHVLSHLRKDLRLEWRSRDSINGMLFFSLLVVVVFSIAFDPTADHGGHSRCSRASDRARRVSACDHSRQQCTADT